MQCKGKSVCPSHSAEKQQDTTLHIQAGSSVRICEFWSWGSMAVVTQQCSSKQLLLYIIVLWRQLGYLHLLWHQVTKSQMHKNEDPQCRAAWGPRSPVTFAAVHHQAKGLFDEELAKGAIVNSNVSASTVVVVITAWQVGCWHKFLYAIDALWRAICKGQKKRRGP